MSDKPTDEQEICPLCCHDLTIKNAVNPLCGHTHCKDCFWKWARKSNACPFCRGALITRDRKKELEMENLLERRNEIRERLEEMYNEEEHRTQFLRTIQSRLQREQNRIKDLKNMIKSNTEILKKITEWKPRIQMWKRCPQKALELWQLEAKEIEKNWRVTAIKKLRHCLDELDTVIRLKDHPYKLENLHSSRLYNIPCLITLCNNVSHLIRASNISKPICGLCAITKDLFLDTLFIEPAELEGTELLNFEIFPGCPSTAWHNRMQELQNNPINIRLSPSTAIDPDFRHLRTNSGGILQTPATRIALARPISRLRARSFYRRRRRAAMQTMINIDYNE